VRPRTFIIDVKVEVDDGFKKPSSSGKSATGEQTQTQTQTGAKDNSEAEALMSPENAVVAGSTSASRETMDKRLQEREHILTDMHQALNALMRIGSPGTVRPRDVVCMCACICMYVCICTCVCVCVCVCVRIGSPGILRPRDAVCMCETYV
jgi:hypothetical protein